MIGLSSSQELRGKVQLRCNRWISRGGRLVLIKLVLKSIPIYWASTAYIPRGILNKIQKKFFSFLWIASKQVEGIPLVKWTTMSNLK